MNKNKISFSIIIIFLCSILFCQSVFSDTRVNSCLGLLSVFEDIADKSGGAIDFNNYNEALAAAYLKAVYDKNAVELTKDEIEKEFNNIFEGQNGSFATKPMSSILENTELDRELKNKIDHNYYGEISTLAAIKSKGFYISQNNSKFYNIAYSGSNMHVHGCGPISLTIALNMLADRAEYRAEDLAQWARDNGYMDANSGTVWAFIDDFSEEKGFNAEQTAIGSAEDLRQYFSEGAVIITCMKSGVFTDEGHFIVLAGLDSQNNVQVVDPISIYRTNKNWQAEQMLKESKGTFWVIKR